MPAKPASFPGPASGRAPLGAFLLAPALALFLTTSAAAAPSVPYSSSQVPIPPAEQGLPAETATLFHVVSPERHTLEGALFDNRGNLYFCDTTARRVLMLSEDREMRTILQLTNYSPAGLAWDAAGRLLLTANNLETYRGAIFALNLAGAGKALPAGEADVEVLLAPEKGFVPNDLVCNARGGLYFSDFRGSATRPEGGVYYLAGPGAEPQVVIPAMAQANGIALSPDGRTLWATEYARNLLHRVTLADPQGDPVRVPPTGSKVVYHFIGPAPDSMRVDAAGNVHVAMVGQGRVLVFNPLGLPLGQILLPDRDRGFDLRSTSLAIHPHRAEVRIVSGNTPEAGVARAAIFAAGAPANGLAAPTGSGR